MMQEEMAKSQMGLAQIVNELGSQVAQAQLRP